MLEKIENSETMLQLTKPIDLGRYGKAMGKFIDLYELLGHPEPSHDQWVQFLECMGLAVSEKQRVKPDDGS